MKVYLGQRANPSAGGIFRVIDGLFNYLPKFGIEIVNTPAEADVIHAHIGLFENFPPDIPFVVSSHGLLWDSDGWGNHAQVSNKMSVNSYKQADVVTAPSQFVADTIARHTLIKPQVIRHGINPDEWLAEENKGYVLWNKSRLDPANSAVPVNELARRAPDISFVSTHGVAAINVNILGQLPPDEMKKYVQEAGVYLDTPKESGGPCFGVLEAMACGVPVLAWNEGGNAESVIHKVTGYLAEVGNYDDLFSGLRYCLEHREALGQNGRQLVLENYTWDHIIPQYIQAYEKAAQKYPVKVSIVVPCYNLGAFLPYCLDSLIAQTSSDWEAVVVDDASTDNSLEIAQTYAEKDVRIRVLHHETNQHVSNSRNNGIRASKGKYIIPLDADDRLAPDAVELLSKELDADRSLHIVAGQLYIVHEKDLTKGYQNNWPTPGAVITAEAQVKGHNQLPYCSMYRRRMWEDLGGYRRRIRTGIEDADFWTRALVAGRQAKVIPHVALYYTIREQSLGKTNTQGTPAWASWFPQYHSSASLPLGADDDYRVNPYDTFSVSVIIPVGPGHAPHIQAAIDSLYAQTNDEWEAVVVNDTGQRWFDDNRNALTPFVEGMPFVHFIDGDTNEGVAKARNKGIKAAKSDRIIFLDVDDIAQPEMVDALLQAHEIADGWIYGDWYSYLGEELKYNDAPDWNAEGLVLQSLAPITGIYWKKHLLDAGLFPEDAPGWEDWDLQLSLLEKGICGTRVKYPLITYQMNLGDRREENFSNKEIVLKYITKKHPDIYKRRLGMGCSKCGGKSTLGVQKKQQSVPAAQENDAMVLVKYVGPMTQTQTIKPPRKQGIAPISYRHNTTPFWVRGVDLEWLLSHKVYELIKQETKQVDTNIPTVPLVSHTSKPSYTWDDLQLKPEVIGLLKSKFTTIQEVKTAHDATLLSIAGIGPKRLSDIRKAVNAV